MNTDAKKEESIELLRKLTEAHGVPGCENAVREIFKAEVKGKILTDKLGGMYTEIKGTSDSPRIMLAAHLDEVGFMVQSITADGLIRFAPLGGWWEHTLLAQRVRILTQENKIIPGVIISKPPHFLTMLEREKVVDIKGMYIDVGANDSDDLRENFGIRLGDPIAPDSPFVQLHNPDLLLAKAFDNRCGVGLAIQAARRLDGLEHPNTVFSGANAQEEVGMRGARTGVRLIQPDAAIVLEGAPADDIPAFGNKDERQAVLGKGVQIRFMDPSAIMNRGLTRFVIETAEKCHIPHQLAVRRTGGTDAGAIHLHDLGVPTVVLSVPSRYIHTHNSIININDYLSALHLILELVKRLDAETVAGFTLF